ncbi:MAG TPA: lipid kinase [Bacteroidales bacterium]|nr:MAG: hypothetical protein A2X11_11375 [Bacteroidetes bacterium GWE2_42_24]OFY25509.1 MAG: hypothetical protein A2X09_06975 [Bacteroidetes bacterium GWF2_43_11]HAQ66098.1 lipid kinase [Bacteroidales bacterium]HBZ66354.1 lipid kinase [Bacteroidales bacterium]
MQINRKRTINKGPEWIAVVNPNAGTRKVANDWSQISEALSRWSVHHAAIFTEKRGDAIELVKQQIVLGVRHFIAVGGDGTLNEVVNGIFGQGDVPTTDFTIALVPVGTGNDWRRTMGVPVGYEEAARAIGKGIVRIQDVGRIDFIENGMIQVRYFANVAGIGYDALVASKVNLKKEKGAHGVFTYLSSLVSSLFRYRACALDIALDDDEIRAEVFSLSIGIGKFNGGGMMQLPEALPDDGLFDLTLIRKIGKLALLGQIKNLYDGTFVKHKAVTCLRGHHVGVKSAQPLMIEADGESIGQTPATFHLIPAALKVVVDPLLAGINSCCSQ